MAEYRRPFATAGEDRRPTLTWPRQIPLGGEPGTWWDCERVWRLAQPVDLPKLFINAEPGAILISGQREFCRSWPNQTEVTVKGAHFIQEDSAAEIADAIGTWLDDDLNAHHGPFSELSKLRPFRLPRPAKAGMPRALSVPRCSSNPQFRTAGSPPSRGCGEREVTGSTRPAPNCQMPPKPLGIWSWLY